MHILVDIIHPAHVHFYRHAIDLWRSRGHRVSLTARRKDIATELLSLYGLEHRDLGRARGGLLGLSIEFLSRSTRLAGVVRRRRPDVLTGIAGIFLAPVSRLFGIPSVIFTDTENAALSNGVAFPLATAVVTPDCFEAKVPVGKHIVYPGYHELAYTHPKRFIPDPQALRAFGLLPGEDFIIVRSVGWGAAHDVRDKGFDTMEPIIEKLSRFGRVLISSERDLPPSLAPNRLTARSDLVLHLQYFARLLFGESATMASECACLGTPAIFVSTSTRGYTNEQGRRYGLVFTYSNPDTAQEEALTKAEDILSEPPEARSTWRDRARKLISDKIDVTEFIVEVVEQHGTQRQSDTRD